MQNNSQTELGHSKNPNTDGKLALIDALNQVFTLFRLNYHNQYLKAFGNLEELNEVKRLWLEMLGRFDATILLQGAKSVIENSEFLPTLHTMIHACERAAHHSPPPNAHSAYMEACKAPSPKAAYAWSHPLVYYAGKRCDWYFLQNNTEKIAFPVFKKHYEELLQALRAGESFAAPVAPILTQPAPKLADKTTGLKKLDALKKALDL